MLESRGLITTPDEINYHAFRELEWALNECKTFQPIVKIIGIGGDTSYMFACAELLRQHNVIGLLAGGAYSAHSALFMACRVRFVYETSYLGVHGAGHYSGYGLPMIENDLSVVHTNIEKINKKMAHIFSEANPEWSTKYWLQKLNKIGINCLEVSAKKLVEKYKVARYINGLPLELQKRVGVL